MEQDQFRVKRSLRSKLLGSIGVLLVVVICFLNYSSYVLFTQDKIAYVYELQNKEAILAGTEFVNISKAALDTLRQTLGFTDFRNSLRALIENQSLLRGIQINSYQGRSKQLQTNTTFFARDFQPVAVSAQLLNAAIPELLRSGIAFFNVSTVGAPPLVAIALADLRLKDSPGGMPIAIGVVSLEKYLSNVQVSNVTITNQQGWILFDTDPKAQFEATDFSQNPLFLAAFSTKPNAGTKEFDWHKTRYLGSYYKVPFSATMSSGAPSVIVAFSKIETAEAMRATYTLTVKFVLLGLMAIGAGVIFAILFARSLTRPLKRLYEATKQVAAGHFDLALKSSGNDEIGALSASFNIMSDKINTLIRESMEKVRLEGELAVASTVQQTLIPPQTYQDPNLAIQSYYEPAAQCGGDWWGFFRKGEKIVLCIADATGHGFPSALITASARSCFSVIQKIAEENPAFSYSPSEMLKFANRAIFDSASGQIMMTFFCGVVDLHRMNLTYANAGQNPPWLLQDEGGRLKIVSLTARGTRLGEASNPPPFEEKTQAIRPQDILFLYTDGILEGKNRAGAMYGKKRLRQIIEAAAPGGPQKLVHELMRDFKLHNEDKPLDDDVTIAVAQVLKQA